MSCKSFSDSEATLASTKANTKQKRLKVPEERTKANAQQKPLQMLGENMSSVFLSTVQESQNDISTVMGSLGHRKFLGNPNASCSSINLSAPSMMSTETETESRPVSRREKKIAKKTGCRYSLRDFSALDTFETLLLRYGTASHMGVRDPSHSFFINKMRTGALDYKVLDKIAVVAGDPLCCPSQYVSLLREFQAFCKTQHWKVAIMAASDGMAAVAQEQKWITMRFGVEKVLNPMTNPLLNGTGGKRTVAKCRQLLKAGTASQVYCPAYQYDAAVEAQLVRIYEDWCEARNQERGSSQAFMTHFDILSLPRLMAFVYTTDANGCINGFAALRKLGDGYHVDPFIATADASKGTSDLLLYSAMALAKNAGISRLSLGFEPLPELHDIVNLPKMFEGITKKVHRRVFSKLSLDGKKAFFDRFYADDDQDAGLHIIYLQTPGPRHMLATMHFTNISLTAMIGNHMKERQEAKKQDKKLQNLKHDSSSMAPSNVSSVDISSLEQSG